ncbi:energy transducer TonB [Gammaproteobacteria bacterium]|nr:energy transducer TonB [Gammaproteobacteria bacterium]
MKAFIFIMLIFIGFQIFANEEVYSSVNEPASFDQYTFEELLSEIQSLEKPIKDKWMKDSDYRELLSKFKNETNNIRRIYKVNLGEISVPCRDYGSICYDVENENVRIISSKYSDFKKVFNKDSKNTNYEGQTVLQQNIGTSSNVLKTEINQDRLTIRNSKDRRFYVPLALEDIKGKESSYDAFFIFSVDLLDEHTLEHRRTDYKEATISSPWEVITYSRTIQGTYMGIALEKNNKVISSTLKPAGFNGFKSPQPFPLYKVTPVYPRKAMAKDIMGSALVEFTVLQDGSVKNVKYVEGSGLCAKERDRDGFIDPYECKLFNKTAIQAAKKLTFPKQENELHNVTHKFTYVLE